MRNSIYSSLDTVSAICCYSTQIEPLISMDLWSYHIGHGSSAVEWMYLTVCPLCDSGHDSSAVEWMYLTVCPLLARAMIAQWENECISLSVFSMAWVKFPAMVKYFKGFSPADHMCFLVHSSKRSGVPLEKCLQSHEDHEVPTDQPGIRATKN